VGAVERRSCRGDAAGFDCERHRKFKVAESWQTHQKWKGNAGRSGSHHRIRLTRELGDFYFEDEEVQAENLNYDLVFDPHFETTRFLSNGTHELFDIACFGPARTECAGLFSAVRLGVRRD
jgi:hypothetical protein